MTEDDFEECDPIGECIHCGAEAAWSQWEEHEFSESQVVCPHCHGPQTIDDIYPLA